MATMLITKHMTKTQIVMVCVTLLGPTVSYSSDGDISAAGSSTIRPIIVKASKAFMERNPHVSFVIGGGGSSHGIKAVAASQVLIGLVSRDLKDEEKEQWPALVATQIGMDGIAIIVNSANPIRSITKQQVEDVYVGVITNWKQLGGEDSPIVLISKEEGRSTLDLFLECFNLEAKESGKTMAYRRKGEEEYSTVKAKVIGPNREAIGAVSTRKNAVAYVSIGTAQEVAHKGGRIALLYLDGVKADSYNVANETYLLRRPLNAVTNGPPSGEVKRFIDFLVGSEGQDVVAGLEFIPLEHKE